MRIRSHILQPAVGVLTVQDTQYPKRLVGPENGPPVFDTCSEPRKHPIASLQSQGIPGPLSPSCFLLLPHRLPAWVL